VSAARHDHGPRPQRGGFILLAVLFVLLALFALSAPFLATARNADRSSHVAADAAQLRLALDGAQAHARHELYRTHPALDPTRDFDDAEELEASFDFPDSFVDPHDPTGPAFDAEVFDLSGRIDLGSASPHVIANAIGAVTRLAAPLAPEDESARFSDPSVFEEGDVVFIEGELIELGGRDDEGGVVLAQRGVGTTVDEEGGVVTTGPRPPSPHGLGAYVLDQRVLAPLIRSTLDIDGVPETFDVVEELRASEEFSMSGGFGPDDIGRLRRMSFAASSAAGTPHRWQRATRLIAPVDAGEDLALRVDEGRWFAPGSLVKIESPSGIELRLVTARERDGRIRLDRLVDLDHEAFFGRVSVLQRRPVNVNTADADVLVALTENLGLLGQNHRIDAREAAALAVEIERTRPFTSFEDFVERLALPASGVQDRANGGGASDGPIAQEVLDDPRDGVALYMNARNANDARLAFSTMPFSFESDGVFEVELRATVNAGAGIERARGVRTVAMDVAPEGAELLEVFTRQRDFDAAQRLSRGSPYWITGPEPTARYDAGVEPPSRLIPHLGTVRGRRFLPGIDEPVLDADGVPVPPDRVFAGTGEAGFCQLGPIRIGQTPQNQGRVLHFDQESRSLEGRFLPDQPVVRDPTDGVVRFADGAGLAQPMSLSMWVRPETGASGTYASLAGQGPDTDRVALGIDGTDLVLRVFDGMGDHRDTVFQEIAEARFAIAASGAPGNGVTGGAGLGAAPGLPTGVWSHVSVDVRGNRPDQIDMLVNGSRSGVRRLGMTRLTGTVSTAGGTLPVETTEGFPDNCVLRIGTELVEATKAGPNAFQISHVEEGAQAGFGGRLARVRFDVEGSPVAQPTTIAAALSTGVYPAGTTVTHYGYSLPLAEGVPSGGSALPAPIGPFRVGRVFALPSDNTLVPITATFGNQVFNVGRGWTSTTLGELKLVAAESGAQNPTPGDLLDAFSPGGGYALLSGPGNVSFQGGGIIGPNGGQLGGVEVVRYSGVTGEGIQIVERGVELPTANSGAPGAPGGGTGLALAAKAYVFEWQVNFVQNNGMTIDGDEILGASTFCMPISIPVPGASDLTFPGAAANGSRFAQITRMDDGSLTEWVRYDVFDAQAGHLVRSDVGVFAALQRVLHGEIGGQDTTPPGGGGPGGGPGVPGGPGGGVPGGGGGVPGGGGGPGPGVPGGGGDPLADAARAPRARLASAAVRAAGVDWDPQRGLPDPYEDLPITRAVASTLHFRGVLGTQSSAHPAGMPIVPVFRVPTNDLSVDTGRPGALDPVFVVDGSPTALGFPAVVHRAHYPAPAREIHGFTSANDGQLLATPTASTAQPQVGFPAAGAYVAFQGPIQVPTAPGAGNNAPPNVTDPRYIGRLVKFPSGELPRAVTQLALGVGASSGVDFGPAAATVDEVVFDNAEAFQNLPGTLPASHTAGAPLVVSRAFGPGDAGMEVLPSTVRTAARTISTPIPLLQFLPPGGGLLRVGEEILAYVSVDATTGQITLAPNGRGLLGTRPQPHQIGETVHWMEDWRCTALGAGVGPNDPVLPLVDTDGFPSEGTVLVGQELVHYTQRFGGALGMPRTAAEDEEGDRGDGSGFDPEGGYGAFRGRYGTTRSSHAQGSPVILFPARYWDRYEPRFDGPELAYVELEKEEAGAYWTGVMWDGQESSQGGPEIVVLQRLGDGRWDGDPDRDPRLTLLEVEDVEGEPIPIGAQADRAAWRVFARYAVGAFDPQFGLSHGWKESPRFDQLVITYRSRTRVLRSVFR